MAENEEKEKKAKVKIPSRAKSFRKSEEARIRHKARRNMIFTMEKKLRAAVAAKDETLAKDLLRKQYAVLDKAVKNGTFKKNKASRKKSRLALLMKSLKAAEAKAE